MEATLVVVWLRTLAWTLYGSQSLTKHPPPEYPIYTKMLANRFLLDSPYAMYL